MGKRQKERAKLKTAAKRNELFDRYITPNLDLIYKLCIDYTAYPENLEDNYVDVMMNFYNYIETYDPEKSLPTWIHIVTKRFINNLNKRMPPATDDLADIDVETFDWAGADWDFGSGVDLTLDNYKEYIPDDLLEAIESLSPEYRISFLLQTFGYKLKEVMDMTYEMGLLPVKNLDTVKSRVFLARQKLQSFLERDGRKRA